MSCFTEEQLSRISHLIREIEKLSDVEKLFLYLQLPSGKSDSNANNNANNFSTSAHKSTDPANNNSSKTDLFSKKPDQETTQTYTWILSHLEVDPNVSLPKQEVYDEYKAFCQANRFGPLCVADFGKAMKHAFPCIKPRRLGQRGNSRYCYSGLRKKYKIQAPKLPDMIEPTYCMDNDCSQAYNQIIKDCRDNPDECPLNQRAQASFAPYSMPGAPGGESSATAAPTAAPQPQAQQTPGHHQPVLVHLNNATSTSTANTALGVMNNNSGADAHAANYNCLWLETTASPFQSPASTPFPPATYSGYITHQDMIPDYYSDDCSRYT